MTNSDRDEVTIPGYSNETSDNDDPDARGWSDAECTQGRTAEQGAAQASTAATTDEAPFPPKQQRALRAIVAKRMAEQEIPGAVVGIWIPDLGTWVHAAGVGDLTTGTPIATDDIFRIANVTTTFTTTAVLQLVDAGMLSLENPLEPFVPGIPNGDQITIHHLLSMRSGIYNYVEDPTFEAAYSADPLMPFGPEDALAIVRQHPPDFPPGERLWYSDTNYILLGLIIEQLTGRSVGTVITEAVIEPLGLTRTSYPTTTELPNPHARGYATELSGTGLRDATRSNPQVFGAARAMLSTLADLRTWATALAEGVLLSPASHRASLRLTPLPGQDFDLGHGPGSMDLNRLIGQFGAIFGYSTWMMHLPKDFVAHDATIVVLTNRGETQTETAGYILYDFLSHFFPDRFPPAPGTPAAGTPQP